MSIKISSQFLAKTTPIIFFLTLYCQVAQATIGYEEQGENLIDTIQNVGEINIGDDILYYDFQSKSYKNAFVDFQDSTTAGIRLEVTEIETKDKRVFLFDYNN